MPIFAYKAINSDGEVIRGTVEDGDIDLAYNNISSSGYHILKIRKSGGLSDIYLKKSRSWGIKTASVIEFSSNLSVMLRAGVPLVTSLGDIAATTDNERFKARLLDVKRTIELGSSFSAALSAHRDVFPQIFVNLIAVGEETGRLDESLSDVAIHLQRMEDLKNAIIRALMYPAFALLGTAGALLFWLVYVLPKMTELFTTMDVKLPVLTIALMAASSFSQKYWYAFIIAPFAIYAVFNILSRKEAVKYYLDAAQLKVPVVKLLVSNKLLALFSEQLRILVSAGVTIDRSFDIMMQVIDHSLFRKALADIKESILIGGRISDGLKEHPSLFPNLVVRMITIGETTGNLTEQLNYLSEYFLRRLDDISQKMGKMIEPIIIGLIGAIFLVIILGLMAPIYDLISGIGK
ncbi:MAG: type II secretion system F family protein [Nitrospiraceae bacterium]|nr:MAG: type II secretion system F family protein [Nitrospiraceae bacterium]